LSHALGEVGLRWFGIAALALVGSLTPLIGCGGDAEVSSPTQMRGRSVAIPMIEGPVMGGSGVPFIASTTFDLAQMGYSEAEYFISGTAA
jgi:hypothetical protein